jgi:hypothetical protein
MASALPSMRSSTLASAIDSRNGDGVWIPGSASHVSRIKSRSTDSDEDTYTQTGTNVSSPRRNGAQEDGQAIERTYRPGGGSGQSNAGEKFAKQGAVKKDARERAEERQKRKNEELKEKQMSSDSDDDRSDNDEPEWEL